MNQSISSRFCDFRKYTTRVTKLDSAVEQKYLTCSNKHTLEKAHCNSANTNIDKTNVSVVILVWL